VSKIVIKVIEIIGSSNFVDYLPPFEREDITTWDGSVVTANEAFKQAVTIIDMQYIEFYCPYEEGQYFVEADGYLIDIFINLIRNAIQYSPDRKRIEFRIQQGYHDNQNYWIIEVIDYGRGIEPKQKPLLLRRHTLDEFGPRVGLTVVQSIISSYGGSVSVNDRVPGEHKKGSIFVVQIPASSMEGID